LPSLISYKAKVNEETRILLENWKPKSGRLDRLKLEDKSGYDPKMRMDIAMRPDVKRVCVYSN